mgnify:CR=1 FL=1
MSWNAVGCSVLGTSHKETNIDCQDYVAHHIDKDKKIIIGAVADGAGSAKYSQYGSKVSVETTISYLKEWYCKNGIQAPTEDEARELFTVILEEVRAGLTDKAKEIDCHLGELASTLIVFVSTPNWTMAMQIGDGFIVTKLRDSESYHLVFLPSKGEYVNETTFVTSSDALAEMCVAVIDGTQEFICASTDGLERMAIDFSSLKAHPKFFEPFYLGIKEYGVNEESEKILEDWLNSDEVNKRTNDDKTLLLCCYTSSNNSFDKKPDIAQKGKGRKPKTKKPKRYNQLDSTRKVETDKVQKENPSFLSAVNSFIAVSFLTHLFAGSLLELTFPLSRVFSALLLLSTLVTFITITNLRDCFFAEGISFFCKKKHSRLIGIVFSISLSIGGLALGFICSKIFSPIAFK